MTKSLTASPAQVRTLPEDDEAKRELLLLRDLFLYVILPLIGFVVALIATDGFGGLI